MIYENKDETYMRIALEEALFDIGVAKAELERKDLLNIPYSKLKEISENLDEACKLIKKHI